MPSMMELATGLRIGLRTARDVWFPPVCAHCRGLVETPGRRFLCERCARQVHRVGGAHCTTCGYPFFGEAEANRVCPHCFALEPVFREGRTAVLLQGPARTLVIEIKYHAALHLFDEVTLLAGETPGYLEFLRGATLVPVPLHPRKQRERGFNQSRLLATTLARAAGAGTRVAELLLRTVDTRTQTRLDRRARQTNLKNAFALASSRPINATDRLVLVDDVFTTGATLNACAAVLRRAGCVSVDVATFGHG
jgi:ComF family protein